MIRVETTWHLIYVENETIWQHWNIEKNLRSIDGEKLDYTYKEPPPYGKNNINWSLIGGLSAVGIGIALGIGISIFLRKKNGKK